VNFYGQLWENFIISERKKHLLFERKNTNSYFWRTYTGAEIDFVEEQSGTLKAFEIKYNKNKSRLPKIWQENYGSIFKLINRNNYLEFITSH